MERRAFVQASLVTAGTMAAGQALAASPAPAGELYELRCYHLKPGKQEMLDDYLSKAFLPALKRFGIGPVGAFVEKGESDKINLYVLIVYESAALPVTASARLAADPEYLKAAADYLAVKPAEAVYSRVDSSLLSAIEGMPRLAKPDAGKPRLINLRIYESHNERAAKKKIEMFNKSELAIFKRVGLTPVLFGETIIGSAMPNLTYMLVFPDENGRKAAWDRFGGDPEWKKIRGMPEYADKEIVSRVTNKILTPTAYSEI